MKDMIWKCEICGKWRPDEKIRVITYPLRDLPNGERNLKYCVDKYSCYHAAVIKSKAKKL